MATDLEYIEDVSDVLSNVGEVRYRKMFGEYMVYVNDKPVVTVCDNTCYVKKLDEIANLMQETETGFPYEGAKEHYVLDLADPGLCREVVSEIEKVTPLPKKKRK